MKSQVRRHARLETREAEAPAREPVTWVRTILVSPRRRFDNVAPVEARNPPEGP